MKLFRNSVRSRKRPSFFEGTVAAATQTRTASRTPTGFLLLAQLVGCFLLIVITAVEGELTSFSCSTKLSSSLGTLALIYSAFPHYAVAKSIRNGQEISVPEVFSSFPQSSPASSVFSSRTLQVSSEEGNSTASELLDSNSSETSYKMTLMKQFKKSQRKRKGSRLKRQMGMAAEIALIAPALQTMGCIPKFFCGMNSKPPADGTSALNDLAYLIRVAMLDDDDVELELEEPFFAGNTNNKGKHGLSGLKKGSVEKIKDDLIIENLAEEELIQEDPANLPFVWQDMEHRIKTKTKPGNKNRFDDEIMDALIVEPEQSSMTAILTGLKSVFRIGRSTDPFSNGNSSQVTPRSNNSESSRGLREKRQRWRRQWKRPFWKTPQFRQDMELAQRLGKTEQDDTKCSSTFNLCPYSVHEMMEIVHGGYKKSNRKKPEWFLNAEGPPESSEEVILKKPFKDKDNLMTTTTERTEWRPTDPEQQILYAVFPHKAIEKGFTTLPTTRKPTTTTTPKPDKQDSSKKRRKKPTKIQHHVEYENEDDISKEFDPEQMDMAIHNKRRRKPWNKNRPPPQGPHHHQQHRPGHFPPQQHRVPQGRRPLLRPQQPTVFVKQISNEDMSNDDNENDKSSSEEQMEDKPKRKHEASGSVEEEWSSEEATQKEETAASPSPPENVQSTPNPIPVAPQEQPSQQFLQNKNSNPQLNNNPIALPRPKYKLQRKQKKKQKGRRPSLPQIPQDQADKSKETSDEEEEAEGDEESQENSSEEVKNTNTQSSPPPVEMPNNTPHLNLNNLRGRPSEEIQGPAQNLLPNTPQSSFEDEPEDSDEKQNSNSASFEGSTEQELISMEMAKVPKPARPPPPHMRINGSHEYSYSDEANGRPQLRPISYSYFKPPPGQNGGPPPAPPPQGNQGMQEPPPNSSTQKYSTGFLNFLFGKNDKSKRKPGSFENQHRPPPPRPDVSEEENADDDDNDDDSDEEGDENRRKDTPTHFTGPEGKFETGHLGNKPIPFNPDFKPPQKPQRPYKGSTSMEDSDEKRFRSPSSSPPPSTRLVVVHSTTPKTPELPRPILFLGKPHRIVIPPPATPPPSIPSTTLPTSTSTTAKPKDSEEDEPESDEEKQSEESKEDDESKESKESDEDQGKKKKTTVKTTTVSKKSNQKKEEIPQPPPIAHYKPASSTATPIAPPKPSTTQSTKTRSDSSDEKQNDDDSNQTKEDDSAEDKASKEEGSNEASSEEDDDEEKKKKRPSRPQRKPEDDELDNAPVLPPLPPVGGDIDAVEEILGSPTEDENPEEQVPYNADEDIPAPPPLVQGFAASLEIQVPSNAPPLIPAKNVAQQASSTGVANQVQGGAPNSGVGPAGGSRDPSELQGVRNPGSSSSNRGPSSGNRNPGNRQQQQQQKPKENEGEKKTENNKKENSSEEKDKSSEESSEEDFAKGVLSGFDFDSIQLGPENPEEENDDAAAKNPPEPPPVFTGSPAQKQHLKLAANQHRPVPHPKPHFYRPQISRNEAITQQQQQSKLKPMRMPLRPMPQNRPSSSFSVSHLLRPLMTRPVYQRKPLDPKVVEWIRESYGIPDLNNNQNNNDQQNNQNHLPPHMRQPNRSGLQSQDDKKETTTKSKETKKKPNKNKSSEKSSGLDKSESESKLTSDYITQEQEAEMAQSLFNTSEEEELNKSVQQKVAETSTKTAFHNSNKSGEKRKQQSSAENKNTSSEKRKHISSILILKPLSSSEKQHASSEQIKPSSLELIMSSFAGKGTSLSSAEKRKKNSSSEKVKPSEAKSSSGERRKSTSTELKSKPSTTKQSSFELRDRLNLPSSVERKKITYSREKLLKSSSLEKRKASSEVKNRSKSSSLERRRPLSSSNEKSMKTISTRMVVKPIRTSLPKVVIRSKSVHKRPSFPGLPPIYGKQKLQG